MTGLDLQDARSGDWDKAISMPERGGGDTADDSVEMSRAEWSNSDVDLAISDTSDSNANDELDSESLSETLGPTAAVDDVNDDSQESHVVEVTEA